jgi:predicted nucleotidyltransferase
MPVPTPSTLPDLHRAVVANAVDSLAGDPRVVGIAAAGSYADDEMDEFSDIDLVVAVEPAHHTAVMEERERMASRIGPLLASFTGEHVGEPRLLICLYGPPLLHIDLKFVALQDAAKRVDDPIVLWERDGRLTAALSECEARYPCPDLQWVEDRFWVWIHYAAAKVGRGEFIEAADFLSFLRSNVFGPLGKRQLGLRPAGVRRLEALAPKLADELKGTIAAPEAGPILVALHACVDLYRRIRSAIPVPIQMRTGAEVAAIEYVTEIERRLAIDASHGRFGLSKVSAPHLTLWKQQLRRVPVWVWEQTELETLVLAENKLSEVPEQIGSLKRLRMLDLGHNELTRVPSTLADLDGLTDFLYLHDNRLTWLPSSFERLSRLRYLNISENAFEILPEPVLSMASLIELRASDNRLASLPDSIGCLSRLRELHLRNNKLASLPQSIGDLQELRHIDLRGNPLTHLPAAIAALPRLEKLDLRWVPTLAPPAWFAILEARGCAVYR